MKSWLRRSVIVGVVGFAFFVGLSYTGAGRAVADIKCKLVNKSTGKGVPAEFSARVKNSIDKLHVCTDTTGNGGTIKVPDAKALYEVRCFPWSVEHGLTEDTLSYETFPHHNPPVVVAEKVIIVGGDGDANFTCTVWASSLGTYAEAKEGAIK